MAKRLAKLQAAKASDRAAAEAALSPVDYIRERVGLDLWSRQRQLVESTWAENITGCVSGQKTGKTHVAAGIAIAWCKLHRSGIVRLASASEDQLIDGLWGEIRTILLAHPELGPVPSLEPSTGWRPSNSQKIIGVTAKEANKLAGRSGPEQLWIVDEACGIDYSLWQVIIGNLIGGGHLLWLTNPVTIGGKVYEWVTKPDSSANIVQIDARETPNFEFLPNGDPNPDYVPGGVPGLATPDGVQMIFTDYGVDSPEADVRVYGRFPRQGSSAAIPLSLVQDAMERPIPEAGGKLVLGVDVARFGDDDSAVAPKRGLVALEPRVFHGLDLTALAGEVSVIATELREGTEEVYIAIDSSGLGAGLVDIMMSWGPEWDWLTIIPVNAAEKAHEDDKYFNRRTELWFNGRNWLKEGGKLPHNQRLKGELIAPLYGFDPKNRQKLESKDDIKKRTKHSPDVAEAFLLSLVELPETAESKVNAETCVQSYDSPYSYS